MSRKKALVLGGTADHIRLIEILKEKGFFVVLMDYLDDPPAKKITDLFLQISILDQELVLKNTKLHHITHVFTTSIDQALLTAAYVCNQLRLPFHVDYDTALLLTNKALMKKAMFEYDIPTSKYKIIKNLSEVGKIDINFPAVMKPVDANSSKGVQKVKNINEIIENFTETMRYSTTKEIIVEEFISGIELSIDAFVIDGNVTVCMITENVKSKVNKNKFTIIESVYDIELEKKILNEIELIVEKIVRSIKLKNGPLLVQALYEKDTGAINVIEFSSRLGGGSKYYYINQIKNFDIIQKFINIILGEDAELTTLIPTVNYAKFKYLYAEPCVIYKYVNFDKLKANKTIEDFFIYKEIGSEVSESIKSTDRCCGIFLIANDAGELFEKEKETSILQVLDSANKNRLLNI